MKIALSKFLNSLSVALDFVEKEILNIAPYHGQRVAAITNHLGRALNFDKQTLFAVTYAALLHDCALKEYFNDEKPDQEHSVSEKDMTLHCKEGEKILLKLPFYNKVKSSVLFHHERADGNGAFGKKYNEVSLYARLIHLADALDVNWSLYENIDYEKYVKICNWVKESEGTIIDKECTQLFFKYIDLDFLQQLSNNQVIKVLHESIPDLVEDIPNEAIIDLCSIFADITDYKSHFTWRHSLGVADKSKSMAEYYEYPKDEADKLYIAGALHDIGKLMISNDILEKPGKLTSDEYKTIQNHAIGTYKLLENINGLEEINRIASLHHEKLDGTGYPFGLKANQLSKEERLMACLDIYQALVEERPYKRGLMHSEAMEILNKMAKDGQLDVIIIADIDKCFSNNEIKKAHHSKVFYTDDINKENISVSEEMWRCPVCGYIHHGPLPKDYICPRCEQPASVFGKI